MYASPQPIVTASAARKPTPFTLAVHTLSLTRSLDNTPCVEYGNWRIPALDMRLSRDQPTVTESGMTAPWMEGARVWLQTPDSLATPDAPQRYLSFTLGTTSQRLGTEPGAPLVWHPVFSNSQG